MKKVGFLEERPGWFSINRLAFILGVAWAIVFVTSCTFYFGWKPGEIVAVFSGIIVPFMGLKLIQKPMEKSDETTNTPAT